MTSVHTAPSTYGRRRLAEPRLEESVPRAAPHVVPHPGPHLTDPPIYQALLRQWASHGRTLPGRNDQEWNRLAAAPVWADRTVRVSGVSGTLVRQGDAR
ncbi:hypothetical protein [Streptomyces sp. NPDC006551]|uniref:hypothetical protein n=1 Tax=Streptomyces sp. NPDC006551 TaxID=3157178 RepID=UPI0033AA42C4